MAEIGEDLWKYNVAKVTFVDVSEDYRGSHEPMPSCFYPIVMEVWLPKYRLKTRLLRGADASGFLYDWHEPPLDDGPDEHWYVGVVSRELI